MPPAKSSGGFTLLEVVIALAIAVLGIAAVAKATGGAATAAIQTRQRMIAVWMASNRLTEIRLTRVWPSAGVSDATATMGGRRWYLQRTVSDTGQKDLRRVEIAVYLDPRHETREFRMIGYLARYRTDEELRAAAKPASQAEPDGDRAQDDADATPSGMEPGLSDQRDATAGSRR